MFLRRWHGGCAHHLSSPLVTTGLHRVAREVGNVDFWVVVFPAKTQEVLSRRGRKGKWAWGRGYGCYLEEPVHHNGLSSIFPTCFTSCWDVTLIKWGFLRPLLGKPSHSISAPTLLCLYPWYSNFQTVSELICLLARTPSMLWTILRTEIFPGFWRWSMDLYKKEWII